MAGSLVGGLLFERTGEAVMLAASGLLVAGALTCVLLSRDLFAVEGVTSRE
jgi:predicted MFS family arabinose efflux permease